MKKTIYKDAAVQDAKAEAMQDYAYGLVYEYSRMLFEKGDRIPEILWDEVVEAWFFDADKELHFFRIGDALCAVKTEDHVGEVPEEGRVRQLRLASKYNKALGNKLCVKEYYSYDADGQLLVSTSRLAGVE